MAAIFAVIGLFESGHLPGLFGHRRARRTSEFFHMGLCRSHPGSGHRAPHLVKHETLFSRYRLEQARGTH